MTADRAQVDPELDDILNRIKTLSITQKSGSRRLDWLAQLDQNLEQWHEEEGMSITKFKQVVKDMAICLSDLTQYPSQTALKHALRKDPSKIVRLAQAKQFKYVKICLVTL